MNKIILASQSPRRRQLMEMAELPFEVMIADIDESVPSSMDGFEAPSWLAAKKAAAVAQRAGVERLVVAADTIVLCDGEILGKPDDEQHAIDILHKLSGRMHEVVTGVCIRTGNRQNVFSSVTEVYFRTLTLNQVTHYVRNYQPFDKAGAYAIQEWIGVTGIEKIHGDYYNVMGLPIGRLLEELREFGY